MKQSQPIDQDPPTLKHDGPLTIATGRSRKELDWKNREMSWSELVQRLSTTKRTNETYEEYKQLPKKQQDEVKDVGGFVGGTLKGGRRKGDAVVWRQLVTLDADFVKGDFWASVEMMLDCACVLYSTHKHSAKNPRVRLVIPLSRPITPDEYQPVARRIAADLGMDFFDDTTYEPHRLMYWPSTSSDGDFAFELQDASWLDPDAVLARYPDWKDPSYWPESSRVQQSLKRLAEKQGNPLEKPGIIGAFCRTYTITAAIDTFLGDVYESAGDGRYTYREGTTTGGLVTYDNDTFAFSHHGTDPVGGRLVNAFDLVRLHKFGELDDEAEPNTRIDRLPSYAAMVAFASDDEAVAGTLGEEQLSAAKIDFEDTDTSWLRKLKRNQNGVIISNAANIKLILRNDPNLADKVAFNEFNHRIVLRGDVPWRTVDWGQYWTDRDDSGLRNYLSEVYSIRGQGVIMDVLNEMIETNRFHPVRDYLNSVWWDGEERIDTLLIDYLGAQDSPYTREVARKMMIAAVARAFVPGVKFDYVCVLVGAQGVGKSSFVKRLGREWHSDSITTMHGKEAYEQLQGAWLVELAELSAMRKSEAEAIKQFISKQEDAYRAAYGRHVSVYPRQCVFWGTTNDEEFLHDKTGNRRFWPVSVSARNRKKDIFKDLTDYEVGQIWAEAVDAWNNGEKLYLSEAAAEEAVVRQERHTEESEKAGLVREYIDTLLPTDWDNMDLGARRTFLHGDFGESPEGTIQRERVCALEVWAELFNGDIKQFTLLQAREINGILRRMKGWRVYEEGTGKLRFGKLYGPQRAYVREDSE